VIVAASTTSGRERARLGYTRGVTRPLAALCLVVAVGCAGAASGPGAASGVKSNEATYVYVGGFSGEISIFSLDAISGRLESRGTASGRSTALIADPAGHFLYAASESGDLLAFAIRGKTGALGSLGRASARGTGIGNLAVHRSGKYLLTANGGGNSLSVLPIRFDGSLLAAQVFPAPGGPEAVGAHPAGESVFVLNANARNITQFGFNTGTGILTPKREAPISLPPRTVPRRLACHPSGRFVYVLQEDGTIAGYVFDVDLGTIKALAFQILATVPPGGKGKGRGGDLQIHPSGRFLYTVDRSQDEVNVYTVDVETGALALAGHRPTGGRQPRELGITEGKLGGVLVIAHQGSSNLTTFTIDATGALAPGGTSPLRSTPVSMVVVTARAP
jgi:6-phosphogluconolactonase